MNYNEMARAFERREYERLDREQREIEEREKVSSTNHFGGSASVEHGEPVKESIRKTFEVIDSDVRKLTEITKPQSRSDWESRGRRPGR